MHVQRHGRWPAAPSTSPPSPNGIVVADRRARHVGVHRHRGRPRPTVRRPGLPLARLRSSPGRRSPLAGPNTITVANTLARDNGRVHRPEGRHRGDRGLHRWHRRELHAPRPVLASRAAEIPTRYRRRHRSPTAARSSSSRSASAGPAPASRTRRARTCCATPRTPGARRSSTRRATFVLTRDEPELVFLAENPIVRVTSSFTIIKKVVTTRSAWSARRRRSRAVLLLSTATDAPVTGTGRSRRRTTDTFVVPEQLFLGSVCTVTENAPAQSGLPDVSFAWSAPSVGAPATVVAGGDGDGHRDQHRHPAVGRPADHEDGRRPRRRCPPGRRVPWRVEVHAGRATRTPVASPSAPGAPTTAFTPADERVPATAVCTITEDTPFEHGGPARRVRSPGAPTLRPAERRPSSPARPRRSASPTR